MESRFLDATERDIDEILSARDSKNTKCVVQTAERLFDEFLNVTCDTSIVAVRGKPKEEICDLLRKFYCGARKKDGEMYAKSSMIAIRYGLQKSFHKSNGMDIVNDDQFKRANEVFLACLVKIKKEGRGDVKHKDAISDGDIKKMYESGVFSTETAKTLQRKVFFELMLYFCNRGRENLRNMRFDDFTIKEDADGKRYVHSNVSRLTKNHRGDCADDDSNAARMYEQPGSPNCTVASFEKYTMKLNPNCEFMWQRPKSKVSEEENIWYDNMIVGKNTLGQLMQTISKEAHLSRIHTNHSIRATCITMLDESGFESRHIMGISKHKSESSLKHYASKLSDKRKREMSESLSRKISTNHKISESVVITKAQRRDVDLIMRAVSDTDENTIDFLDMLSDFDDPDLASVLDNPNIFGISDQEQSIVREQSEIDTVRQKAGIIPPQPKTTTPMNQVQGAMVYNFHGCSVTINNHAHAGM